MLELRLERQTAPAAPSRYGCKTRRCRLSHVSLLHLQWFLTHQLGSGLEFPLLCPPDGFVQCAAPAPTSSFVFCRSSGGRITDRHERTDQASKRGPMFPLLSYP